MRPGPRWLSTIRFKAMALVVALAGTLVVFLATYFPARHIAAARGALEDKAVTYAHLVSRQVESGLAFDDRQTVREVFGATAQDPDVRAIALYTARGGLLLAYGELAGGAPPRTDVDRVDLASGATFVRVTAPVIAPEGPRGTLVLELGTDRLAAEARATRRAAAIVALGSLAAGFAVAWLMARSLARRLGAIARATRAVAEGDLSTSPLDDASADEVGQLARAFNAMSADIRGLVGSIREAGLRETERLDALVRARTGELDARNGDMRLVLDHVSQGLLLLDRAAVPAGERSAAIDRWFGEPAPGATFADLLRPFDARAAVAFELNWEQLLDGFLPAEVAIDQLPRRVQVGGRAYELEYTPLMKGDAFERVLVMISDVTERRAVERAEAEQREVLVAFERMTEDRAAFLEFLDDSSVLVDRLCGAERPGLRDVQRDLHTLKGNASLHGLGRLAAFCHELEDAIVESRADLEPPARRALRDRWDALLRRIETLLGGRDEERLTVSDAEYRALVAALEDDAPRDHLARLVGGWRLETAGARLARHAAHAQSLAQELGKGPLAVSIEGGHVRFTREVMVPFWAAFGHAVRNAVAHGLERSEVRAAAGKPAHGTLTLRSLHAGDRVVVEIADDGGGVDWDTVRERALAAGLPAQTLGDLQAALFHDGLTTRLAADGHSGRGLGMGILRAECERLAGSITVRSAPGLGTTLSFSFPAAVVADVRGEPRPLQTQRRRSVGGKRDIQPRAGTGRR